MKKIYAIYVVFLINILFCFSANAKVVAFLINTTSNHPQITEEFQKWSKDDGIKHFFDKVEVLCNGIENQNASKENIIKKIQELNQLNLTQLFIFLFAEKKEQDNIVKIVTADNQTIDNELFQIKTRYACLIEFGEPFLTTAFKKDVHLWRVRAKNEKPFLKFRNLLIKDDKTLEINQKSDLFFTPVLPCHNARSFKLERKKFQHLCKAYEGHADGVMRLLDFYSSDNFISFHKRFVPLPEATALYSQNIESPYFYVLTNNDEFKVFKKSNATCVFTKPIKKDFSQTFISPAEHTTGTLVFSFLLANHTKLCMCIKKRNDPKNPFHFITIDGKNKPIKAFDFGRIPHHNDLRIFYLIEDSIHSHIIENVTKNIYVTNKKSLLFQNDSFNEIKKAKMYWRDNNKAFILGKNTGFYCEPFNETVKLLYSKKDDPGSDYHIDTFFSGSGKPFGFIISSRLDEDIQVYLGIHLNDSFRSYDLTKQLKKDMEASNADENAFPIVFFKDNSQYFQELSGIMMYNCKGSIAFKQLTILIDRNKPPELKQPKDLIIPSLVDVDLTGDKISTDWLIVFDRNNSKSIFWVNNFKNKDKDNSEEIKVAKIYSF